MQLPCMFKETCMSQYCEYSVLCMSHVTCIENIQNPCMLHAHNMQTCMENVPNPCMLHAKNMPVTCRDLGRISTRDVLQFLQPSWRAKPASWAVLRLFWITCVYIYILGIHHMHNLAQPQPGAEDSCIIANKPHLLEWGCGFIMAVLSEV